MTDDPIESVEDLANRKMWGLPGVTANIIKGTGSSVVAGPAVQMLEIISKGVVDGYVGVPWTSVQQFKLADYTRSATLLNGKIFQLTFSVMLSREKWDAISPEDQQAIRAVMGDDFGKRAGQSQDALLVEARTALEAAGVVAVEGSEEFEADLRALGKPMTDAWIEKVGEMGIDGQEVLDFYQSELERFRADMGS